jgi:hypothetical protein
MKTKRMSRHAFLAVLLAAVSGCASVEMGSPTPLTEHLITVRGLKLAPAAVGRFALAPGLPAEMDRSISLRGSSLKAPGSGSFAEHLKATLTAQLKAAGWLDPTSRSTITGELLQSEADAAIGTGTGSLGARFSVVRDGIAVYRGELRVQDSWESSFMGAVAIPLAMQRYEALYGKLVAKLIDDPDFRRALAP